MSDCLLMKGSSSGSIPAGLIAIWSGASTAIPAGWSLCNGSGGTPDLRNLFVIGAGDTYSVGSTGGAATHRLTTDEMPAHSHSIQGNGSYRVETGSWTVLKRDGSSQTESTGGGKAHNNLPPYYALCYIMKT